MSWSTLGFAMTSLGLVGGVSHCSPGASYPDPNQESHVSVTSKLAVLHVVYVPKTNATEICLRSRCELRLCSMSMYVSRYLSVVWLLNLWYICVSYFLFCRFIFPLLQVHIIISQGRNHQKNLILVNLSKDQGPPPTLLGLQINLIFCILSPKCKFKLGKCWSSFI